MPKYYCDVSKVLFFRLDQGQGGRGGEEERERERELELTSFSVFQYCDVFL